MAQMEVLYLPGKEICGQRGIFDLDLSKIIISGERAGKDGPGLHRILREKYGLELEMEAPGYVLALTSVMDTEEGFQRLAEALKEMDACLAGENLKRAGKESPVPLRFEEYPQSLRPRQILSIASAMDSDGEETLPICTRREFLYWCRARRSQKDLSARLCFGSSRAWSLRDCQTTA